MNQSLKSILAFFILLLLASSALGWMTTGIAGVHNSQFWMRVSTLLLPPAIALLIWGDFRRDHAPDILKARAGKYFEQEGFCFAILPAGSDSGFAWQVMFQNRYERPCTGIVSFRPATRFIGFGRADLSEVKLEIQCPGGSFGIATIPYGFDQKLAGKKQRFELAATSHYSDGKGKMLRFRDGMHVSENQKSGGDLALTALSALALHAYVKKPATFVVRLPEGVSSEPSGNASQEILWQPGDPMPA